MGQILLNQPTGLPALATSVIDVKDENGGRTAALKITSTESDPYLRDAPAVKVILVTEGGDVRYSQLRLMVHLDHLS